MVCSCASIYVIKGSFMFLFIVLLVCFAFGNMFYIISMLDDVSSYDQKISGPDVISGFMFAYRTAMADIQFDKYEAVQRYRFLFYLSFIFMSFTSLVVLLNLLIALMSDIYLQVMMVAKSERMRVKCQMISENEYIFQRQRIFNNVKYIVLAEVELLQHAQADSEWQGLINNIQ